MNSLGFSLAGREVMSDQALHYYRYNTTESDWDTGKLLTACTQTDEGHLAFLPPNLSH